jgi:lipopolysaccharide/colanic/teichoic acid biosynthesis glycosyltransferase
MLILSSSGVVRSPRGDPIRRLEPLGPENSIQLDSTRTCLDMQENFPPQIGTQIVQVGLTTAELELSVSIHEPEGRDNGPSFLELASAMPRVSMWSLVTFRVIDVVLALAGLLLLAPLLATLGALVRLTGAGPTLFKQQRVGRSGDLFEVVKFRTMTDGTHDAVLSDPEARRRYEQNDFKLFSDDPRITRIGRLLRKSSLDELPQLINVLRGQMSLVGIRPLLPQEVTQRSEYDQQLYRLLKPGLTGLWQVEGRSAIGDDHRIELDRRSVETWTVRSALRILARTPKAVLVGIGAH